MCIAQQGGGSPLFPIWFQFSGLAAGKVGTNLVIFAVVDADELLNKTDKHAGEIVSSPVSLTYVD